MESRAWRRRAGRFPTSLAAALLALGLLAGGGGWSPAGAETQTGAGPTVGCTVSAFQERVEAPVVPLPLGAVQILAVTLTQPCPGLLRASAVLTVQLDAPPPVTLVVAGARITCLGGGCPVTGTPITGLAPTAISRPSGAGSEFRAFPVAAVFPDVPAGTYLVEIVAGGSNASLLTGQLQVVGRGQGAGPARPPSP